MLEKGCLSGNILEVLLNVRADDDISFRRGRWKSFISEVRIQMYMLKKHAITLGQYLYNIVLQFGGEVVLSNKLRTKEFKLFRVSKKNYTDKTTWFESIDKSNERRIEVYPLFSVAMCVYGKDNAEWFDTALESVIVNQTVKPSELVLVVDGPIPEKIEKVIEKYTKLCEGRVLVKVVRFPKNKGLGEALKVAIENCSNEIIARMDSDDIAVENRYKLQLSFMQTHNADICGGQIEEFIGEPSNVVGKRIVPQTDSELKSYMRKRCPFNHMTVMYKKSAVIDVGNYQDWFWNEDYYLWIRMALKNYRFANLSETLVKVRVGKDMYARRGGDKYFKSEVGIQKLMLEKGLIDRATYGSNCVKRFIVQKVLPNRVRGWVFKTFARS